MNFTLVFYVKNEREIGASPDEESELERRDFAICEATYKLDVISEAVARVAGLRPDTVQCQHLQLTHRGARCKVSPSPWICKE